jgi:hypothetical protein
MGFGGIAAAFILKQYRNGKLFPILFHGNV